MEAYKVLKRLGVGTYGSAYLVCLKRDASQQLVLKKVKIDEDNEKETQQAMLEVQVLSKLHHPLVLGYREHFMYKGHLCILTEYCEAGDLYSLLRARKTPLLEGQILDWFVQVLLAIQYVHSNSILHRDLKTQNIFLTRDGTISLGDFGISRPLNGSMDLASTLIGTPYYMSPEVMSSQPYDFKSDMWSLGCCLYEMMSLKHAFDASDMSSLVMKIMRGEHLPIPSQYSPDLRDLAKSLLSRQPKLRPTPEAILRLPWLKEHVARVREKVIKLEQARHAAGPRALLHSHSHTGSGALPPAQPASQVTLNRLSVGPQAALPPSVAVPAPNAGRRSSTGAHDPAAIEAADLDRELEAAKGRLRQIQAEREALAMKANRPTVVGVPGPTGGRPPMAPVGGHAGAALAGNGAGLGPSPGGGADFRRASRDSGDGSPAGPADPRARKEARRQEELRQREVELLEARKAYFEERKVAETKKWHMRHGSSTTNLPAAGNSGSPIRGRPPAHAATLELQGMHLGPAGQEDGHEAGPHPPVRHAARHTYSHSHGDMGAAAEFEAELQHRTEQAAHGPASAQLLSSLKGGGVGITAAQRALALRDLCVAALGPQLFDLLYAVMRKRMGQVGDEAAFRQELLSRLGPHRMQYLHLIDQLLYYEDWSEKSGLQQ